MSFVDLKSQYELLKIGINRRIEAVLDHGNYIMGPEVTELEEQLSDFTGVKHVKTCANGTDAIVLALMAMNVQPGDAVFCPTFTFVATAEAISTLGATPIFIDSEVDGFNMCSQDLDAKIAMVKQAAVLMAKVIITVDLFGLPANYPAIKQIAKKHDLRIIEDAAQGFGGKIGTIYATNFGDIATTSFFPTKPLGCYGDGGAVFTQNDEYAEIIDSLRVHGKGANKYNNIRIGMNSRLDTIQAAILLEKITVLEAEIEARDQLAQYYSAKLGDQVTTPTVPETYRSAWAQYTVLIGNRTEFIQLMQSRNIPHSIYYDPCVHNQPVYSHITSSCPHAEEYSRTCLSLPLHIYKDWPRFD